MLDINCWLTGSIFADTDHPEAMVRLHLVEKYNLDLMYRIWQMDTGRQRGKTMKLSLTKFLLDASTQQEIQQSIIWVTYH